MNKLKKNPSSKETVDRCLTRITNLLLLNASFINNIGLLNGKMGIAIFLFEYSKYSSNKMFCDYAGELIDEIFEEIDKNTPLDLNHGLIGIGWGIIYLIKHGFVEADADEVLGDLEKAIFGNSNDIAILIEKGLTLTDSIHYNIMRNKGKHKLEITDKISSILLYIEILEIEELSRLSLSDITSTFYLITQIPIRNVNKLVLNNMVKMAERFLIESKSINPCTFVMKLLLRKLEVPLVSHTKVIALENDEDIINYCTELSCNKLLFRNLKFDDSFIEQSAKEILLNKEKYWNRRLNKLNFDSFGLEKGWAGLGWFLMSESINSEK